MSADWRATCVDLCRFSATSHRKYLPLQKKRYKRRKVALSHFSISCGQWRRNSQLVFISLIPSLRLPLHLETGQYRLWPAVTHEHTVSFAGGATSPPTDLPEQYDAAGGLSSVFVSLCNQVSGEWINGFDSEVLWVLHIRSLLICSLININFNYLPQWLSGTVLMHTITSWYLIMHAPKKLTAEKVDIYVIC